MGEIGLTISAFASFQTFEIAIKLLDEAGA